VLVVRKSPTLTSRTKRPNRSSRGLFGTLAPQSASEHYTKGQQIFQQGDVADSMFRIEHGNVKLAVTGWGSRGATVAILRAGDCFGEACLLGSPRRACTATSLQESTIGRISKRAMLRRLHDEPAFANALVSFLLLRIGRTQDDLVAQLVNSSEKRLARLLLQLSDFSAASVSAPPVENIDQGTLAQAVGTTRSRVSYFMNRFRRKGFIDYNGSLEVHEALLNFLMQESESAAAKP
jgi:CRP-like cAMP-binding protein